MLNRKTEHVPLWRKKWLWAGSVAGIVLAWGAYFYFQPPDAAASRRDVLRDEATMASGARLDEPLSPIREPTALNAQKVA
jgi:hypothetical protein